MFMSSISLSRPFPGLLPATKLPGMGLASAGPFPTSLEGHTPPMRPDWSLTVGVSWSPAADVCLFSREVYNVGLSLFQHSSNMGRLVRHAAWRADRVVAVVSHP